MRAAWIMKLAGGFWLKRTEDGSQIACGEGRQSDHCEQGLTTVSTFVLPPLRKN